MQDTLLLGSIFNVILQHPHLVAFLFLFAREKDPKPSCRVQGRGKATSGPEWETRTWTNLTS